MKNNIKIIEETNDKSRGSVALIMVLITYMMVFAVFLLKNHINPFENLIIPFMIMATSIFSVVLSIKDIHRKKRIELLTLIALVLSILFFLFISGVYISLIPRSPY